MQASSETSLYRVCLLKFCFFRFMLLEPLTPAMKLSKGASKLQISPHLLYYWRSTGLLSAAPCRGELNFKDLVRARFICLCRKQGISLQTLRRAAADNSDWQTKLSLYSLGKDSQGQILVRREKNGLLLPTSRQLLLDFEKKSENRPISFRDRKQKQKRSKTNALSALIQKLEEHYETASEQKNSKNVEKILKRIVALDPKHLSAWIEIGNFYFNREQISKARRAYERSIEIDPTCIEALYNLANLHFKAKHYGASIRYFQRCLQANPHFIEAYYNFGLVLYHLGRRQEASELLENYLINDPESFWADQARQLIEDIRSQNSQSTQDSNELRLF